MRHPLWNISRFISILLLAIPTVLFAQVSADPLDPLYEWFDTWEGRGYLQTMPVMRPYPENVILSALNRVTRVGDAESRRVAQEWITDLEGRFRARWEVIQETRTQDVDEFTVKGAAALTLQGRISPSLTVAGSIAGVLLDASNSDEGDTELELLPRGRRTEWDLTDDWSQISVGPRDFAALNQVKTSFAWGGDSLYLHAGIMRRSFGPFHDDSVIWSDSAFQSPGFVAHWAPGSFRFTAGIFSLTGTQLFAERTPLSKDEANRDVIEAGGKDFIYDPEEYPGKWVFLQDFRWLVAPWLDIAFFESVTWGPRFELAYLVPLKWTFNAQGNVGFADSSKMGLSAVFRPRRDVRIPVVVYVDDASFNDLAKLDFDTKLKLAFHTGVEWNPEIPVIHQLKLDYLALLPYMYTHDGEGGVYAPTPNYVSYTHQGKSLGPAMEPNSDRVRFTAILRPVSRLRATVTGTIFRHANAGEGIEGLNLWGHNGTITDDGRYYQFLFDDEKIYVETGRLSFQDDLRFLNQDHIETTYQAGVDLSYAVPIGKRVTLTASASYTFEYIDGPLSWESTGRAAPGTDASGDPLEDDSNSNVIVYDVVQGDNEINHFAGLKLTLSYR